MVVPARSTFFEMFGSAPVPRIRKKTRVQLTHKEKKRICEVQIDNPQWTQENISQFVSNLSMRWLLTEAENSPPGRDLSKKAPDLQQVSDVCYLFHMRPCAYYNCCICRQFCGLPQCGMTWHNKRFESAGTT